MDTVIGSFPLASLVLGLSPAKTLSHFFFPKELHPRIYKAHNTQQDLARPRKSPLPQPTQASLAQPVTPAIQPTTGTTNEQASPDLQQGSATLNDADSLQPCACSLAEVQLRKVRQRVYKAKVLCFTCSSTCQSRSVCGDEAS